MQRKNLGSLEELGRVLAEDMKTLRERVVTATNKTATIGKGIAKAKAPQAHGDLADSIDVMQTGDVATIRSWAPYSAAVEVGSRPHMPPLAPLVAWVKTRGMRGLAVDVPSAPDAWAKGAIAAAGDGRSTPVDAAERIAWAIAKKIATSGTEPSFWMRKTAEELTPLLDSLITSELSKAL